MLLFALLAYRTSIRTSTGATPYSLVYGMEAVFPIERYVTVNATNKEWPERSMQGFTTASERSDDLILRKVLHITPDSRGKFAYKYDGLFVVRKVFSGGAIILSNMDGIENVLPVNADALKKYYP
ncbi:hypothetical protein CRG98_038693 [Punica granatum]|uniref:Uncharacterized protein n=1 Tax=Punica granatum TaxID=22663 RepID=A0A2I0IA99_PUNGR|nr:hypothetical protein CRG98_038693 [Punica granatum]